MTTKKTTATPTPAATVQADDLVTALKALAPFAGSDDYVPIIAGIHLQRVGGRIHVAATDRYVAALTTIPAEFDSDGSWEALISTNLVKKIVADWKAVSAKYPMQLTIKTDLDQGTVIVHDQLGVSMSAPMYTGDGKFPDLMKLMKDNAAAEKRTEPGTQMFRLDNLVKLNSLKRHRADSCELHWPAAGDLPVYATIGDHSLALVMPMRPTDEPVSVDTILAGGAK